MNEYFDYEPPRKNSGGGRWIAFIAVALIFAVLGGLGVMAATGRIAPENSQSLALAATATPKVSPSPDANAEKGEDSLAEAAAPTQILPALGGQLPVLSGDNPVVDIAEKLTPSVVGICNYQTISYQSNPFYEYFGGGRNQQQPQEQEVLYSTGSGVIISQDGYIITNNHVIDGAGRITVLLPGSSDEIEAKLVGSDVNTDIAVLKIDRTGLDAAPLGDSDALRVGELAVAIGNPLGNELSGTVTVGFISAINRQIQHEGYTFNMIQTDAAINPGNSGGALINIRGEVIGINTMKSGSSMGGTSVEGIGFAIPINEALPIAQQLIQNGYVSRPGLGIEGGDVGSLSQTYNVPQGALISAVMEGGPAHQAGLQAYDIITAIDGQTITTFEELSAIVRSHKIGDTISLTVFRDSTNPEIRLSVTLGDLGKMNSEAAQPASPNPAATPQPSYQPWPPR